MNRFRCLLVWLLVACVWGQAAEFRYDFRKGEKKGSSWVFENLGTRKNCRATSGRFVNSIAEGLPCGPELSNRYGTGIISYDAVSLAVSFKLASLPTRSMFLCTYQENTWRRAWIGFYLDAQGRLAYKVRMGSDKTARTFEVKSKVLGLKTGIEYQAKVVVRSGGKARLYLDGVPVGEKEKALCFSDLPGVPVDQWHPFGTIGSSYGECTIGSPLDGTITGLTITNLGKERKRKSPGATQTVSRKDINCVVRKIAQAPKVDGVLDDPCWKNTEWTIPMLVLGGMSETVNGQWLMADEKFVKTAATGTFGYDDTALHVAVKVPFPKGMRPKAEQKLGGEIWLDDCVEIFLAVPGMDGHRQVLVNAKGAWQGLSHDMTGGSSPWKPEGMKLAATLGETEFCVELSIPFKALETIMPQDGMCWTGNLAREGKTCGGLATWAPVGTRFNAADRFGKLIIGSRQAYYKRAFLDLCKTVTAMPEAADHEDITKALDRFRGKLGNYGDRSWENFKNALASLRNELMQIINQGRTTLLWQRDIWSGFGPDVQVPFGVKEVEDIELTVARGARGLSSFLVTNFTSRPYMAGLYFKPRDKKSMPVEAVRFRELSFIELNGGSVIPDPIFDLPLQAMMRVPANQTGVIWLDVDARQLKPGTYSGTIQVVPSFSGFQRKQIKLTVTVSPVDIRDVHVRTWTYPLRNPWLLRALKEYDFNAVVPIPSQYYPTYDKNGKPTFPRLDEMIQAMLDNGVPLKDQFFLFYPEFQLWATIWTKDGKTLKFMDPEWQVIVKKNMLALRDYLKERYGISYDQYCFYPTDEPNGDPKDPKTKAYKAFVGGRFIKSIDSRFQLFCNPYQSDDRLQEYIDLYDILEPYYPSTTAKTRTMFRDSGKEIWSYVIYEKSVGPLSYRKTFWNHMEAGFQGCATFYDLLDMSGDGFNSYDSNGGVCADYGTLYENWPLKKVVPSRRMEAWYLGLVEFKLHKLCVQRLAALKKKGLNVSAEQKQLDKIVQSCFRNESMDEGQQQLIKLGEKLLKMAEGK